MDVDDPRYPTLENGLRHMTGNVWEWMRNLYGDYPRTEVTDPTGPLEGVYRSLRGGSWLVNNSDDLRATLRSLNPPGDNDGLIGFRVVGLPHDSNK